MPLRSDAVPLSTELDHLRLSSSEERTNSRHTATNTSSDRSLYSGGHQSNSSRVAILQSGSDTTSSCSFLRRNVADSSSNTTTVTCNGDGLRNSYRELTEDSVEDMEERRWNSVNRHLQISLEGNSVDIKLWKKLAMELYEKIEDWRKLEILSFKPSLWDFCAIYTNDEIDKEIMDEFMQHLELEGLMGTSLANLEIDEDQIDVSAKILNGSTKIFILDSVSFMQPGLHRLQYKDPLMKKLRYREWKTKLIPLHPCPEDNSRYKEKYPLLSTFSRGSSIFGLGSTKGILLGDRANTVRQVRTVLTTDVQATNDASRRRCKENFIFAIDCIKEKKCEQLRQGLNDLRRQFESLNYSTEHLAQICMECENLHSWSPTDGTEQIIRLQNCSEISIGPSFHFNMTSR